MNSSSDEVVAAAATAAATVVMAAPHKVTPRAKAEDLKGEIHSNIGTMTQPPTKIPSQVPLGVCPVIDSPQKSQKTVAPPPLPKSFHTASLNPPTASLTSPAASLNSLVTSSTSAAAAAAASLPRLPPNALTLQLSSILGDGGSALEAVLLSPNPSQKPSTPVGAVNPGTVQLNSMLSALRSSRFYNAASSPYRSSNILISAEKESI